VLVTHGKRGSLHLVRAENGLEGHYMPPLPRRKATDPTGAGDTFVAAWLAARLLVGDGWRPQAVAAAMSSLAVLTTSLADMPTASDVCRELVRLRP
jgi:sugar/nucleoside kinase (ribokinase family)